MFPITVIPFLIGVIRTLKERYERRVEQSERDRLAQQIADGRLIPDILSGSNPLPFALYLRPFALEEWLREYQVLSLFFPDKVHFDFILHKHLRDLGILLVSIGAPDGKVGAGHVSAPESLWTKRFRELAKRATTIIVVPGIHAGIMSEIRWLRAAGLLDKTVFFKPTGYPKIYWQKTHEFYRHHEGIEFPGYSLKQLSFRIHSSGRCYDLIEWGNRVFRRRKREIAEAQMRAVLSNNPVNFF